MNNLVRSGQIQNTKILCLFDMKKKEIKTAVPGTKTNMDFTGNQGQVTPKLDLAETETHFMPVSQCSDNK